MVPVVKRAVQLTRINSSLVSKQRRRHLSQSVPPKGKPEGYDCSPFEKYAIEHHQPELEEFLLRCAELEKHLKNLPNRSEMFKAQVNETFNHVSKVAIGTAIFVSAGAAYITKNYQKSHDAES